jgi:hypothetical protein
MFEMEVGSHSMRGKIMWLTFIKIMADDYVL